MLTYDSLVADTPIQMMARNTDLVAAMPLMIQQAHRDMVQTVDHDLFREKMPITLLAGADTVDLTAGFTGGRRILELRSITATSDGGGTRWSLRRRNLEAMLALYPDPLMTARPAHYAEDDTPLLLRIFPATDADVDLSLRLNVEPAVLSSGVQTNVMTAEAAQLLELRVFLRAAMFLRDEAAVALYRAEVVTATQLTNAQVARRRRDETQDQPIDTANAAGS